MKNIYQRINIIKLIKILFQWLKAKKGFLIIVRELKNKKIKSAGIYIGFTKQTIYKITEEAIEEAEDNKLIKY